MIFEIAFSSIILFLHKSKIQTARVRFQRATDGWAVPKRFAVYEANNGGGGSVNVSSSSGNNNCRCVCVLAPLPPPTPPPTAQSPPATHSSPSALTGNACHELWASGSCLFSQAAPCLAVSRRAGRSSSS